LFGGLLFLAGAQPAWLPAAFLVFCATGLPWRVYHYTRVKPRNRMFLLDFCYLTSALAAALLVTPAARRHAGLVGAVYALADGPVSSALLAWQCTWVFHSAEHTVRWGCMGSRDGACFLACGHAAQWCGGAAQISCSASSLAWTSATLTS
jgi:hypothetical protein